MDGEKKGRGKGRVRMKGGIIKEEEDASICTPIVFPSFWAKEKRKTTSLPLWPWFLLHILPSFPHPPPWKQCEWRATFSRNEWDGMETGRGSLWPPQPSRCLSHMCGILTYEALSLLSSPSQLTSFTFKRAHSHTECLGQVRHCFITGNLWEA